MIRVNVVRLPADLTAANLKGHAVVVFDVLRATSTIATALANGAIEIRAFASIDDARIAHTGFAGKKLLAGEIKCLPPAGFDLGNSPGDFTSERVAGRTIFLSTTNGTRAIVASSDAEVMFAASLLNASATARALATQNLPVTLVCAGSEGAFSHEDFLGAGAVAAALRDITQTACSSDVLDAIEAFEVISTNDRLTEALSNTLGGRNLQAAGLTRDIDTVARVNSLDIVAEVVGIPPVIRRR